MGYVGYIPATVGYAGSRGATGYTGSIGTQGSIGYTGSAGGGSFSETNSIGINTLSSVQITGTAGQISFTANSTDPITVNDLITLSGTEMGTQILQSIFISGSAGQFGCSASDAPIVVGQAITISGTKGGSGSITGYTGTTKTYYVIATDGASSFTLSETPGGSAITTGTGVPSGLTFTNTVGQISLTTVAVANTTGNFTCAASSVPLTVGQIVQVYGTNSGSSSITGYSSANAGQTYYIIATNGTTTSNSGTTLGATTFQLSSSLGGSAITTTAGSTTGLSFYVRGSGALQNYTGTTKTYYVKTTNGTSTAILSETVGGAAISSTIGTPFGVTYTCNQIQLSSIATTGTAGQFSCSASSRQLSNGQKVRLYGTNSGSGTITGYSNPTTYYIIATNGSTTFTLSTTKNGSAITTTAGTLTGLSAVVDVGQNLISFAYTVGKAMVYVNGVKLIQGVDFTATDGSTIELVNGVYSTDYVTLQTM